MSANDYYEISDCQHKQHLSISISAYKIIMGDMFNYMNGINFSGFICTLFQLFWEDSDANIPAAVQRYSEKLTREICEYADLHDIKAKNISSSIKPLSNIYEENLKKRLNQPDLSVSNGKSMKITLRKDTYNLLHGDNSDAVQIKELIDNYYNGNYAGFLREVIEDYASRPGYDRESIMYKDTLCTLQDRISARRFTAIDYISGSGKKIRYKCKPYMIISDKEHLYHYLVGEFLSDEIDHKKNAHTKYEPQIIRISRIVKIRTGSSVAAPSGKLTENEKLETEQFINLKNRDSKTNNTDNSASPAHQKDPIIIRMGHEGLDMYKQILHLRPILEKKPIPVAGHPDLYDYSFDCRESEAFNYFIKFGNKAKIISPQNLADDFMWFYKRAYREYQTYEN